MVDLWDVVAEVTADVQNTGAVEGAEIAQLYIGIPGADQPIRQLRGYWKGMLTPGQSATVTFPLTRRDLSVWNTTTQLWQLQAGQYGVWVGASSRILPLVGTLEISN